MAEVSAFASLLSELGISPIVAVAIAVLTGSQVWLIRSSGKRLKGIEDAVLQHGMIIQNMADKYDDRQKEHDDRQKQLDQWIQTVTGIMRDVQIAKFVRPGES